MSTHYASLINVLREHFKPSFYLVAPSEESLHQGVHSIHAHVRVRRLHIFAVGYHIDSQLATAWLIALHHVTLDHVPHVGASCWQKDKTNAAFSINGDD